MSNNRRVFVIKYFDPYNIAHPNAFRVSDCTIDCTEAQIIAASNDRLYNDMKDALYDAILLESRTKPEYGVGLIDVGTLTPKQLAVIREEEKLRVERSISEQPETNGE